MRYDRIIEGKFISRPNRFIANVEVAGVEVVCHVKNTGRCRELLTADATVFLQESDKPGRKTKYDLITVKKGDRLINMDSQAPNKVFYEWVKSGLFLDGVTLIKPECKYKNSRFDFYIEAGEEKIFVEVKGVTLENDGVVMFPDAPTERGVKHINELCDCVKNGYKAYIVFVVQTDKVKYFTPNEQTHKAFADALREAEADGVEILAVECNVTKESLDIKGEIDYVL